MNLASHLWGWGSIPVMASSGKAGSCLPLVGSLQYRTLANLMYWFPLPFQLPVVIWPVQCWKRRKKPQINNIELWIGFHDSFRKCCRWQRISVVIWLGLDPGFFKGCFTLISNIGARFWWIYILHKLSFHLNLKFNTWHILQLKLYLRRSKDWPLLICKDFETWSCVKVRPFFRFNLHKLLSN